MSSVATATPRPQSAKSNGQSAPAQPAEQKQEHAATLAAISGSQAMIEFQLDGTVITANDNFLAVLGYRLEEIQGQHHSMFVDPETRNSAAYRDFWPSLARGESFCGQFQRVGKGGREVWIQGAYTPVFDEQGQAYKVVKIASDITEEVTLRSEATLSQAMLENAAANILYADKDFIIRYVNPSSAKTLRGLQQFLPIPVDQLVGQPIDIFHKNPAHQRNLIGDPTNLPHRAQIDVGTEILELVVCAVYDSNKSILGTMVTWEVITERVQMERAVKENAQREQQKAEELAQIMAAVANNANTLGASAEELTAVSTEMSANAEETANQANVVSAASEQVTKNVQTVATGVEEMSASIREISENANSAAKVAQQAVTVAENTNQTIGKLGESSSEIGKVIKVITSIAEQTNLLALNATIEAARAAESGKGFAVVANEVKELAKETGKATEDISQKIEAIQGDTSGAVDAIQQIGQIIGQINDISNTIASAVEEQSVTTNEISRNVGEAAKGSSEISQNITNVASAAQSTTQGANNTRPAADELSRMAAELQKVVAQAK